jgi:hypothetical protein
VEVAVVEDAVEAVVTHVEVVVVPIAMALVKVLVVMDVLQLTQGILHTNV